MKQARRKLSKKKIALLIISILLLFFMIKLPIDSIKRRNDEIARKEEMEKLRIELQENIEKLQNLQVKYEELYSDTMSSQDRFEMIMDSILYDYYFSKYNGVEE